MGSPIARSLVSIAALAAGLPAAAVSVHPNPMPFHARWFTDRTVGALHVVGIEMGLPEDATVHAGSVAATDVVLLLQASITPESTGLEYLYLFFVGPGSPTGVESIPVNGVGAVAGPHHDVVGFAGATFRFPTFMIDGDRISDVFFVAVSDLEVGDQIYVGGTVPDDGGSTVFLLPGGTVVPEPGTAELLGLGLAALTGLRRSPGWLERLGRE